LDLIRTYFDANAAIVTFAGSTPDYRISRAFQVLEDKNRLLLSSDYLWLEVIPKSLYFKELTKISYINKVFERSEKIFSNQNIIDKAISLATSYGLSAMDSLHIASSIEGKADEFVTFEKSTKPYSRIPPSEICVVFLNG
jgi:predicted nucleic acid-binding protein